MSSTLDGHGEMPAAAGPTERSAAPGVPRTTDEEDSRPNAASFPIVGIGASAGGLEAFTEVLAALPPNTGMAFVLAQHLDPDHPSLLTSLLARTTEMSARRSKTAYAFSPTTST